MDFQRESEWMNQQKAMDEILKDGFQAFADRLGEVDHAFEGGESKLCCMDEGTPMGDFRSAGSGILMEGSDRETFIQKLKAAGAKSVTSHTGCGAAALYREQHGITDKTVDEVAIEQAKKMAQELGVAYDGHITDLQRPAEFHNARVVYVDATGSFNPSRVDGLPPGFVVSATLMTPDQAVRETLLAAKIAFGHHGFGEKFTNRSPFLIVAIGEQGIVDELRAAVNWLGQDASRVRIDSVVLQPALAAAA